MGRDNKGENIVDLQVCLTQLILADANLHDKCLGREFSETETCANGRNSHKPGTSEAVDIDHLALFQAALMPVDYLVPLAV